MENNENESSSLLRVRRDGVFPPSAHSLAVF